MRSPATAAASLGRRLDHYQRRHAWVGFPLAVFDKFVEDRGPQLAGLLTYYGFLSLFPLLLVLTTTVRLILREHPDDADRLLGGSLARFPVVGPEIAAAVHPIEGSAAALTIGVAVAVYGGLAFTTTVAHVFDHIWGVPVDQRPHPLVARLRGAVLLVLLGVGLGVTTALSALAAGPAEIAAAAAPSPSSPFVSIAVATLVNAVLFVVAFRVSTARRPPLRRLLPGALFAAAAWQLLELGVVRYATAELTDAYPLYGVFGLVLALLAWIYLEALAVVIGAEVNVVLADRLWPRSLFVITHFVRPDDLTDADRRSLASYARSQRYQSFERIDVAFDPDRDARPD